MRSILFYKSFLLTFLLIITSCGRPFTAVAPSGFASYKRGTSFKAVSPDHIVYRVRTCNNQPYADFDFWREAVPEQMKNAGYRVVRDTVISVNHDKSLILELTAPLGNVDYSYMVMMKVKKNHILIAEAAGIYEIFQRRKEEVIAALCKTAGN